MSQIEEIYQSMIDAMTPAQKIERMVKLNQWALWNVERRISEEQGPLPPEIMKWEAALQIYGHHATCRQLIEEQLARVRHHRVS